MAEKEKLITITEIKNVNMKGFTFIEGFPDLGLAGTIGTKYLIDKLKFEEIGHIDSKLFLPMIRIQDGLPIHPVRLYANRKNKVVIVIAEQLIDNLIASQMAQELINWIKKKGINKVISTSGARIPDGKMVYAFASNQNSKKIIEKHKIEMIKTGLTSGVTALLMLYLKDSNMDAICLLGNAKNNADYLAAAEVVKTICSLTGMKVDIAPLLEEAKVLEKALVENIKTIEENKVSKNDSTPMYV
jgi:uncharacterized protein